MANSEDDCILHNYDTEITTLETVDDEIYAYSEDRINDEQ
jgi:hypothetical protein